MILRRVSNIVLLGFAFMLLFTAFRSMIHIQKKLIGPPLGNPDREEPNFQGDKYSRIFTVYYISLSISIWIAPIIITYKGPIKSMILGASTFLVFMVACCIHNRILLFICISLLGFGTALLWTGQGTYLTLNSSTKNIYKNSGIFWSLFQFSLLFWCFFELCVYRGDTSVYLIFMGQEKVGTIERYIIMAVLMVLGLLSLLFFKWLPPVEEDEPKESPYQALKDMANLFHTWNMRLLFWTCFYTGMELEFFTRVFSNCITWTKRLESTKWLLGLSILTAGVGHVSGGCICAFLARSRERLLATGCLLHVLSYALVFINFPDDSSIKPDGGSGLIKSSISVTLLAAFLLGMGDAFFNTVILVFLGTNYAHNSTPAFAASKFAQIIGLFTYFLLGRTKKLTLHIPVLLAFNTLALLTFMVIEWRDKHGYE